MLKAVKDISEGWEKSLYESHAGNSLESEDASNAGSGLKVNKKSPPFTCSQQKKPNLWAFFVGLGEICWLFLHLPSAQSTQSEQAASKKKQS